MALYYSWDLGFNFATAKSSSTGNYSLMMGFQGSGAPVDPITAGNVDINNYLFFNLFNLGPVGTPPYTYNFSNVTITFNGSTGTNAGPFNATQSIPLPNNGQASIVVSGNTETITVGPNVSQLANGPSAIFVPGTNLQAWSVLPSVMMNLTGNFQVSVSITILRSDGVKGTFFHDPEMVVGSAGGSQPIDDGSTS